MRKNLHTKEQTQTNSTSLRDGLRALEEGNTDLAIEKLSLCTEVKTDAEICYRLGVAHCINGNKTSAIKTWKNALQIDATHEDTLYDLALAYTETENTPQAAMTFSRLLSVNPEHGKGRFNFGNLMYRLGRTEEAIALYAPLTEGNSPPRGILVNLGRALRRLGRLKEADACYQRALLDNPADHFTQWNRSHVLCLMGRWAEGFQAWEHRLLSTVKLPIHPNLPEWLGPEAPLPDRMLVIGEQGHGDTIQCLRYIPTLVERGCSPCLAVHPSLVHFMRRLLPTIDIVDFHGAHQLQAEAWAPCFSLPYRLNLPDPAQTQPPDQAPLFQDGIKSFYSKAPRLSQNQELRIGLAWAGNPGHDNDQWRSMSIKTLSPLLEVFPNVKWQSLQLGPTGEQLNQVPTKFRPLAAPEFQNFEETAELISQLSLVICVDTAVAHVAATLGIPVWLLLAAEPDWRWGYNGDKTSWYPSTRLFRQKELGNWNAPIQEIGRELESLIKQTTTLAH